MSVCNLCNKTFEEDAQIVSVGDLSMHPDCFNCSKCGSNFINDAAKIGQPYPAGDKFQCGACFHGTCAKCGKPTIGPHLTVEDKLYHKECYDIPKCANCGKDIFGKYVVVEGKGSLHEECYP